RTRWLRRHEIDALVVAVGQEEGIDEDWRTVLVDAIIFAASTGVRFGCLCELRPSDYADGFIVIDRDKNGERVHIPIAGDLEILVDRRVEAADFPGSYLFPGPKGGNARASIRRWLPRIVRAAGLVWGKYKNGADGKVLRDRHGNKVLNPEGVTFHTFRHSFASNAFLSGVPDSVIQRLGNWKTGSMLDRYRHHADEQLRDGAKRVAACVAGGHTTVTTPRGQRLAVTGKAKIACDTKRVSRVGR
ncbi:MAG: site-specific integrase, partial [Acidobacteria bacterium]|nr:site-specific integrase [Acidobacteriota bacterium]